MSELEKVEKKDVTLVIGGRERVLKYGFSAWAQLEKRYNGVKNLDKMEQDIQEKPFETIPFLIYIGLQDKEGVTEENVLDDYGMGDIQEVSEVLYSALYGSLPKAEEEKKAEGSL